MARPGRPRERGAAAVEFALVLPILLLFLGGIIDFGRAFFTQVVLTNAAREGVRAAVVQVDNAGIVTRATAASTGITPTDWLAPQVTPFAGCTGASPPVEVKVRTSATFDYYVLGFIPGITDPTTLSSTAVMGC